MSFLPALAYILDRDAFESSQLGPTGMGSDKVQVGPAHLEGSKLMNAIDSNKLRAGLARKTAARFVASALTPEPDRQNPAV
jgi:hypothetical protein